MGIIARMITLKTEKREKAKGKTLRKKGVIPAVFYGRKQESTLVSINIKDFGKVWSKAGESTVVELDTDAGKISTLIHDVQVDPVTDVPIHVDFYVIEKDRKVTVSVPLSFVGVSPAVKELGAILVKVMHEIEIDALPTNLPHEIEIDLSLLNDMESQILVKDIKMPEGATATAEADEVVALLAEAKEEIEEAPTPIDMDSIEVEKKGKKEGDESTSDAGTKETDKTS